MLGFLHAEVDIAAREFNRFFAGEVSAAAHRRRIGFEGALFIQDEGQGTILDLNQAQCFFGDLFGVGGYRRDFVADVTQGSIE